MSADTQVSPIAASFVVLTVQYGRAREILTDLSHHLKTLVDQMPDDGADLFELDLEDEQWGAALRHKTLRQLKRG